MCVLFGVEGRRCVTWVGVHCRGGGVCVCVCVCVLCVLCGCTRKKVCYLGRCSL